MNRAYAGQSPRTVQFDKNVAAKAPWVKGCRLLAVRAYNRYRYFRADFSPDQSLRRPSDDDGCRERIAGQP